MKQQAPVFGPGVQVLLYKNVDRTTAGDGVPLSERFKQAQQIIDLAPWLSDRSGVCTAKSVREPAGGFSITLADRPHLQALDSLYGIIEPMDVVEIRMARNPYQRDQNGGYLPIVMRGFVSSVRRNETIQGGKPAREVIITGQDYGKLWQIFQIFYEQNFPIAAHLVTEFKLFAKYGVGFKTMQAPEFVRTMVEQVLNPFIRRMNDSDESGTGANTSPVQEIKILDADLSASPGTVAPYGINQSQGGTLYGLLAEFGDVGPWNELFLEDREDGVFLVYRPNPFYSVAGQYLPGAGVPEPARAFVTASEIQTLDVGREDCDVANYYWCEAPRSQLINGSMLRAYAVQGKPESFFTTHRNASADIYGLRKMMVATNQGDPLEQHQGNGLKKADRDAQYQLTVQWVGKRRVEVVEQNKDNIVFESGTIALNGREDIRAGMYIDVLRGDMGASYYVTDVQHRFVPYVGFFTTLRVERGTGFIERARREASAGSPYFAELSHNV